LALKRQEKEALVDALHGRFARSIAVIMTDVSGLSVSGANSLRKMLRETGAELRVCKNTLSKRAAKGTPVEVLADHFGGPNALAIAYEEPVAMAKALVQFAKDHEALQIRGGMLNGKYIESSGVETLARLPGREVLLAQLLSVMVATPRGLVQVLAGIPRKLLYVLKAIEEKKA